MVLKSLTMGPWQVAFLTVIIITSIVLEVHFLKPKYQISGHTLGGVSVNVGTVAGATDLEPPPCEDLLEQYKTNNEQLANLLMKAEKQDYAAELLSHVVYIMPLYVAFKLKYFYFCGFLILDMFFSVMHHLSDNDPDNIW